MIPRSDSKLLLDKYKNIAAEVDQDKEEAKKDVIVLLELQLREEKERNQAFLAWCCFAVLAFLVFIFLGFSWIPAERIDIIAPILTAIIYGFCGVIVTFMGASAFGRFNTHHRGKTRPYDM